MRAWLTAHHVSAAGYHCDRAALRPGVDLSATSRLRRPGPFAVDADDPGCTDGPNRANGRRRSNGLDSADGRTDSHGRTSTDSGVDA